MTLGNNRPAAISALEDRIWRCLFSLATNKNVTPKNILSALKEIAGSSEFREAQEFASSTEYSFFGERTEPPTPQTNQLTEDIFMQDGESTQLAQVSTYQPTEDVSMQDNTLATDESTRHTAAPNLQINQRSEDTSMQDVDTSVDYSAGNPYYDEQGMFMAVGMGGLGLEDFGNQPPGLSGGSLPSYSSSNDLLGWGSDGDVRTEDAREKCSGEGGGMDEGERALSASQRRENDHEKMDGAAEGLGGDEDEGESHQTASQREKEVTQIGDESMESDEDPGRPLPPTGEKSKEASGGDDEIMESDEELGRAALPTRERGKVTSRGDHHVSKADEERGRAAPRRMDLSSEEDSPEDEPSRLTRARGHTSVPGGHRSKVTSASVNPTHSVQHNATSENHAVKFGSKSKAVKHGLGAKVGAGTQATHADKAGSRSHAGAEGELDKAMDASAEVSYDQVADGLWIEGRVCNLDIKGRPKIQCDKELSAYSPSGEKVSFRPNIHVSSPF